MQAMPKQINPVYKGKNKKYIDTQDCFEAVVNSACHEPRTLHFAPDHESPTIGMFWNLMLRFNNPSVQNLPGPSKTIHATNLRFQEISNHDSFPSISDAKQLVIMTHGFRPRKLKPTLRLIKYAKTFLNANPCYLKRYKYSPFPLPSPFHVDYLVSFPFPV
ncbi:uncharacterized protein EV154DRAFT_594851 [Mucor mucedo]|uniref:uncharacterized protein n=1 Tax=Mucor mucedo TaxID=29922 RepID=UPI00221FC936|nr:uncharacterized protein EV154DRAFT_594851 [Mucor mucedo]KAI7887951.1 hypothetical protein EV154DRAFT_594851 [Mucor mucedo]